MAPRPDQRVMLQLLVERGQSYADLAHTLGVSEAEVRRRAHAALDELAGPEPVARREPPTAVAPPTPPERSRSGYLEALRAMPKRRKQVAIALAALAPLALVVVLAASGVFGGDDESQPLSGEEVLTVQLEPLDESSQASGVAAFGLLDPAQEIPIVQVEARGLEPSGEGRSYVAWLYNSTRDVFPIAQDVSGPEGRLSTRTPLPAEVAGAIPNFRFVDLTLARDRAIDRALRRISEGKTAPQVGKSVLRGAINLAVGASPDSSLRPDQAAPSTPAAPQPQAR